MNSCIFWYCVHFVVPVRLFFSHKNSGPFFLKESQLQQSRATQPKLIIKCMLGRVSMIHRTLTWTT